MIPGDQLPAGVGVGIDLASIDQRVALGFVEACRADADVVGNDWIEEWYLLAAARRVAFYRLLFARDSGI